MMHKGKPDYVRIAIVRPDGGVSIMQFVTLIKRNPDDPGFIREPTSENIAAEITKSNIPVVSWRIIQDADIPADRTFRAAFTDDGVKIGHDMDKARAIHMDRIRKAREPRLAETDKLILQAIERGENIGALGEFRQKLRDIPQTLDLSKAATVEDLKAIWPEELK